MFICWRTIRSSLLAPNCSPLKMSSVPSSDYAAFQDVFTRSNKIVVLTGAGISAESGVPTFRGAGGLWRKYQAQELADPNAFARDPALVWQFYAYRRQLVSTKEPNLAHKALSMLEAKYEKDRHLNKQLIVVTQNVDELHRRAGSKRVLELHGTLFKTRCTECNDVRTNFKIPIVPALADIKMDESDQRQIEVKDLPRCIKCQGLLRPHIVWFNESLEPSVLSQAEGLMRNCDLLLVVGTSSVVYPAAMFAPMVAARGVPVAEFNLEPTSASDCGNFFFDGPCSQTLPKALGVGAETFVNFQF